MGDRKVESMVGLEWDKLMIDSNIWMDITIELLGSNSFSFSSAVINDRVWGVVISCRLYGCHPCLAIAFLFELIRDDDFTHTLLMI